MRTVQLDPERAPLIQWAYQAYATDCTRQAILIEDVERLIERYYERVQITPAQRDALAGMLHYEFDQLMAAEADELAQLTAGRDRLEHEQERLLQAHYADAIPALRILAGFSVACEKCVACEKYCENLARNAYLAR